MNTTSNWEEGVKKRIEAEKAMSFNAGIQTVVDWIDDNMGDLMTGRGDYGWNFPLWEEQLKEWGINP